MSKRSAIVWTVFAGLSLVACAADTRATTEEAGDEQNDSVKGPIVSEQDIEILENAIKNIELDGDGQFNKNEVIEAVVAEMGKVAKPPGPSERVFIDDLISALDKNGDKDTALVLSGPELENLTSEKYEKVVSFCFQETVAYARVLEHLVDGELGAATADEDAQSVWGGYEELECD
jgi:hypothetical protein